MENIADKVEEALLFLRNDEKATFLQRFFKTGKGEYAEGDRFLGIVVPEQRKIAKEYYKRIDIETIPQLVTSPWHECRLTGLIMLAMKMDKEKDVKVQQTIVDCYLNHLDYINNWDLVDLSAPYVLGKFLLDKEKTLLHNLSDSGELWRQRISIISTLYFIRKMHFDTSLEIAEKLVYHKHDLIHKAVGWVLREVGKKDAAVEKAFLNRYYTTMPRTMLRYAIERFNPDDRAFYMNKNK